ncbi:MAG: hypothetical protein KatS3mg127_0317 [Silanimonas sp.]|nr:MAG: hypothetical protein KatS3mg127_0317 [Silanimonas sp.]
MDGATLQLATGEALFREGDPPTTAFILEEGQIEIRATQRGRQVVLAVLGPGSIVGEMAVIDEAPRTATALALAPCRLRVLERSQIAERLAQADPILRALLQGTLQRYRSALAALQGRREAVARAAEDTTRAAGVGKMRLESQLREALQGVDWTCVTSRCWRWPRGG